MSHEQQLVYRCQNCDANYDVFPPTMAIFRVYVLRTKYTVLISSQEFCT
jgi:hypothetical protein